MRKDAALVLLSGGQDSATCLAWALQRFVHVETIGFDYGQKHRVELEARAKVLRFFRTDYSFLADDHMLDARVLGSISESALTSGQEIVMQANGLPSTFVPGRNLLFLTLAAAVAYRRGIKNLVTGVCETDFSGYPDCRDDTIKAMQVALNLGMNAQFNLHTPLMWLDKAQTWAMAEEIGYTPLVNMIVSTTHTCYNGVHDAEHLHEWGHGCGECPACVIRREGYYRYVEGDYHALPG